MRKDKFFKPENSRELTSGDTNGGRIAEKAFAERHNGTRDGRPGKVDVYTPRTITRGKDKGKEAQSKTEVKYFRIVPATAKKNAVYNSANGFKATKDKPLTEQLKAYCRTFDKLAVIWGPDPEHPEGEIIMSSAKAYDYLLPRMQNRKGYNGAEDSIRFTYAVSSGKSGGFDRRMETLRKAGWII